MPIKIVTLNIECDKHLPRIIDFFKYKQPDVILLQEVYKKDIPYILESLNMQGIYTPSVIVKQHSDSFELGILTCSKLPIINSRIEYYFGNCSQLETITQAEPQKMARALIIVEIMTDNKIYYIANTHFTWTPNAQPNQQQRIDCKKMLAILESIPDIILCGDFNAPRGGEIFSNIADRYKDNIPKDIISTIDPNLHSAAPLYLVVDGLFSTTAYTVHNVEVIDNLSDHCAVMGTVL